MRNPHRFIIRILTLGVWLLSETAWVAAAAPPPEPEATYVEFKQMAVMPFFVGSRQPNVDEAMDRTLSCPVGELCAGTPGIEPGAGRDLTRMVYEELRRRFGDQVASLDESRLTFAEVVTDESLDTARGLAQRLGREMKADYVVIGTLWRYRDRGEVPGMPESPASVAFALYLVEVETGRRLWRGLYDEAQRQATDHLLQARKYLKMGFKWLSARELACHGVKQVLAEFPSDEELRIPVPAP
ncbi:MAG: hypothetical protein K9K88_13275 [Desulfobacterales bacterium]|nr:hypothetical protein [Desulfobacterales bacterium]